MNIDYWVAFGFFAQFVFFLRFFVQWVHSERAGKSVVPVSFWWLSIIGSVMILIYAVKRKDPVFMSGQFLALFIYIRNIVLHRKSSRGGEMP